MRRLFATVLAGKFERDLFSYVSGQPAQMKRALAAIFVFAPIAAAHAHAQAPGDTGQYALKVQVDDFDKSRSALMMIGRNGGDPAYAIDSKCTVAGAYVVTFQLTMADKPGTPLLLMITSDYLGADWLFIGETPLQILADGALVEVAPFLKDRKVMTEGDYEVGGYRATPAQLRQIANAKALKVRIRGNRGGNCVFSLKPASVASIRKFVAHEVPQ